MYLRSKDKCLFVRKTPNYVDLQELTLASLGWTWSQFQWLGPSPCKGRLLNDSLTKQFWVQIQTLWNLQNGQTFSFWRGKQELKGSVLWPPAEDEGFLGCEPYSSFLFSLLLPFSFPHPSLLHRTPCLLYNRQIGQSDFDWTAKTNSIAFSAERHIPGAAQTFWPLVRISLLITKYKKLWMPNFQMVHLKWSRWFREEGGIWHPEHPEDPSQPAQTILENSGGNFGHICLEKDWSFWR